MTAQRRISADTRLLDCPEGRVGLALPLPISDRLDALVDSLEAIGEKTSRKDLLASLILAASARGEELAPVVKRYRLATARDVRLDGKTNESTVPLHSRRPGPRPRKR
jgi:hypothetical protein